MHVLHVIHIHHGQIICLPGWSKQDTEKAIKWLEVYAAFQDKKLNKLGCLSLKKNTSAEVYKTMNNMKENE